MVHLRAGILLLPLVLAGCQGTPFGDRLSASFPGVPAAGSSQPGPAPAPPIQGAPQASRPASPAVPDTAASPAARPAGQAAPTPARSAPQPARPPAASGSGRTSATAPYRITLRLPLADPAAPAEGVTQALRAAGVPFEVETIERMNATSAAADVPATGAPAVRPAPAPR
ncbi:hypothetical protein NZK33_09365 [Cyanobium sp. FGCU-6]|jgi:hypothetical protein|nr:hypothetical protein [Cyanobium sp. FGCU6]